MNGLMGVVRDHETGRIDHCLYFITSGLMLFPVLSVSRCSPVPLGDYDLGYCRLSVLFNT